MRLPGITQGAAPEKRRKFQHERHELNVSPFRHDVNAPLREARTRVATFNAIAGVAQGALGLYGAYVQRETKRQVQEQTLGAQQDAMDFQDTYGNQLEFSMMDFDDPAYLESMEEAGVIDVNQKMPGYRFMPEFQKKKALENINKRAEGISDRAAKEKFIYDQTVIANVNYMKNSAKASQQQIAYSAFQTTKAVNKNLLEKNYGGARLAVLTGGGTEESRDAAILSINTTEQTDYFNEALTQPSLIQKEKALKQLRSEDPEVTAFLTDKQEKVFASQLESDINSIKTGNSSQAQAGIKIAVSDINSSIDDMWSNKKVNPKELQRDAALVGASGKHPVLMRELEWTIKHQPDVSQVMLTTPSDQLRTLQSLKDATSGGREASYLIDQMEKAIKTGQAERSKDTMSWGADTGLYQLTPVDYSSSASLVTTLGSRLPQAMAMQNRYGTFTGYLSQAEMNEFGQRIENMGPKQQVLMFRDINAALGENAESFYEQMKVNNVGGSAPIAGQMAARGNFNAAMQSLDGNILRRKDPTVQTIMKDAEDTIAAELIDKFGTAFAGNVNTKIAMGEAVRDIYAVTQDLPYSIQAATGGMIEYRGYTIQNPDPGKITEQGYNDWIPSISRSFWKAPENKMYGYTDVQARANMINGEFVQIGVGSGGSRLEHKGKRVTTDGVTDYIFRYDSDIPTTAQEGAEVWKQYQDDKQREKSQAARFALDPYAGGREGAGDFNKEMADNMIRNFDK